MSKLDDEVVSCAHLALYGRPISSSGVEATGVGSRLTTVINCDESRIEERTEVHTPTSFVRRTLIILRHRRIADGVYFDGSLHHRQAKHQGYENR